MKRFLAVPAFLLALALSACGFHLRNALTLPSDLGPVQVVSRDPYSPLAQSLQRALERTGADTVDAGEIVATDADAGPDADVDADSDTGEGAGTDADVGSRTGVATLNIRSERWDSLPISVDQFGRAQEYTLRYAVVFVLTDADGRELVPQQAVEMSRDYVSVPTDSTGTDTEQELLAREMQREMTASILRRIDAASRGVAR